MAEPISIQQLKDASEDAITLADFIYKPANVMIPRRLAADINSLQYYLDYMSSYAQRSYETYDEMVANALNLPNGVSAFVTNDLDTTKNGIYTYNGVSFIRGDYQPENAAKDFVEAKLGGLQVFDGKVRAQDVSTNYASSQEDINKLFSEQSVDTIAQMQSLSKFDGNTVFVKDLQGGTFVYNSNKALLNDGVVHFSGWVRASFMFITTTMAGCKADGIADDTAAFQKAVDYTSSNGFALYVSEGVHLFKTATFKRWSTASNYQTYAPIIEIKNSNTIIKGTSLKSVLKYGDGITYIGWEEIGYVGAQLFSASPATKIDNFELEGCTIDGNGYNNKIRGLNGGGSAAGNQAVYINKGDNTKVHKNVFKDLSGYQAIFVAYNTNGTIVDGNEFYDTGWLDGTNWTANYSDQSTIFLGGTYICKNNTLVQSTRGMFAGTAIEVHGRGTSFGNVIKSYASPFLSAAVAIDSHTTLTGNTATDCTLAMATDTQNGFKNHLIATGNNFVQNTQYINPTTLFGKYRSMIYCYGAYAPNDCFVEIVGNTFDTDGLYAGYTDAQLKLHNTLLFSQLVTSVTFKANTVANHKGSILKLAQQTATAVCDFSNNSFVNCGVDNSNDYGNSVIYYDNYGEGSYGVRAKSINFSNNNFSKCKFGQYFGSPIDVAGDSITPEYINVNGDIHDTWLTPMRVKEGFQVFFAFEGHFDYKVLGAYNASNPVNFYGGGYNGLRQNGVIRFKEDGFDKSYKTNFNTFIWTKFNESVITQTKAQDATSVPANSKLAIIFDGLAGVKLGMTAQASYDKYIYDLTLVSLVSADTQGVIYVVNNTAAAIELPAGNAKIIIK